MQHSISNGPYFATLDLVLEQDEEVFAELDSMLAMSPNIEISAKFPSPNTSRWWGSSPASAVGESVATATFRAKDGGGNLSLAPRLPGNILCLSVTAETSYYLTQGSFLASGPGISVTYKNAGLRGILSKQGLKVLQADGAGTIFCSSYGGLIARTLSEDESFVIDNRFVVAFSESIQFQLVRAVRDLTGNAIPGGGPRQSIYRTRNGLLSNPPLSNVLIV